MRVILLDDEILALNYLEHQIRQIVDVEIVGKFVNPYEGKEAILREEVELVFLDIHMPELNGIELAEQLLEYKPNLDIVFVTAYDDYAIKAFELNALDYVMKPVRADRLLKTMLRIMNGKGEEAVRSANKKQSIRVRMFKQFLIEQEDSPAPVRWRTSKAQELFLYLLQHRGQFIRKSLLIELLWSDLEPNRAFSQLYTAVYHIRKTLEPFVDFFKISNAMDGYVLDVEHVWLDVDEWEGRIHSLPPIGADTIETYESMMALYTGDYLQEFDYWWAESERQRVKLLGLRTALQIAKWYETVSPDKAEEKYVEICERYPTTEEAHFALMKLYRAMNNTLSMQRQYRILQEVLSEELNEQPSAHITEWYNKIIDN